MRSSHEVSPANTLGFVLCDVSSPSPQVQSAFMRMDVNGDGTLTKREMLAAEEFTPEEVNN